MSNFIQRMIDRDCTYEFSEELVKRLINIPGKIFYYVTIDYDLVFVGDGWRIKLVVFDEDFLKQWVKKNCFDTNISMKFFTVVCHLYYISKVR